jgi:hypothetical protein
VPKLTFLFRKILPCEADYLGQGGMVSFNLCRNMLTLYEGRSKENKSVRRPWDVIFRFLLGMSLTTGWYAIIGRWEKNKFWGRSVHQGRG